MNVGKLGAFGKGSRDNVPLDLTGFYVFQQNRIFIFGLFLMKVAHY